MAKKQPLVTIKGKKSGLILTLNDRCPYESLINELKQKLASQAVKENDGPLISVKVEAGYRYLTDKQKKEIKNIIRSKKQLFVEEIYSEVVSREECEAIIAKERMTPVAKMVRSGQVLEVEGDLLLLGDVNPGGKVVASGNIYIMGALKGMAHAGCQGDNRAVIAASLMKPMQLMVADILSRSPDFSSESNQQMEYAYVEDDKIVVDRIQSMFKQQMSTISL